MKNEQRNLTDPSLDGLKNKKRKRSNHANARAKGSVCSCVSTSDY